MESEKTEKKKITAGQVCKKYNLTPDELDQLLEQIYTELEANSSEATGPGDDISELLG